jgi:hypothetical protein
LSDTVEALEYFVRRGLALLLIPIGCLFALMVVGFGNATTDASPTQLYAMALIYLGLTIACIVSAFRTERMWIGWIAVLVGWAPILWLFGPAYV